MIELFYNGCSKDIPCEQIQFKVIMGGNLWK